jgi:hypothetical protein
MRSVQAGAYAEGFEAGKADKKGEIARLRRARAFLDRTGE